MGGLDADHARITRQKNSLLASYSANSPFVCVFVQLGPPRRPAGVLVTSRAIQHYATITGELLAVDIACRLETKQHALHYHQHHRAPPAIASAPDAASSSSSSSSDVSSDASGGSKGGSAAAKTSAGSSEVEKSSIGSTSGSGGRKKKKGKSQREAAAAAAEPDADPDGDQQ